MRYHLNAAGEHLYTTDDSGVSERYTQTPPPETAQREVARYLDDAWVVLADWRGVDLYDKVSGEVQRLVEVGPLPDHLTTARYTPGYVYDAETAQWRQPGTAEWLAHMQSAALKAIDSAADLARLAVTGDPLRVVEYQRAVEEAEHFIATGEALPAVTSWAAAKGWTNQQAAESILTEAQLWNQALYALRDIRLQAKEAVRVAITVEEVENARDQAVVTLSNLTRGVGNAGG